ncbi:MAG TPA: dienelactone hydrolase family protein [Ktedonobacteraceae bacterium]|nr:dienelactone hydrolase family protein [Ktedonobacteraceae bacterium]
MCYDDNAIPPTPPGEAGAAQGEDLVLIAEDGNRFYAYFAWPEHPSNAQILIYPDVRGLHNFYKELAMRFAEVGITALAIDYFGRTAGLSARDSSFDYWPHVREMTLDGFFADAKAALAYLRTGDGTQRATFVTGFCMGGSLTFISGTQDFDLAGVIGFYAGLSRQMPGAAKPVVEIGAEERYPLLGLFGGADQGIPVELVHRFEEGVKLSGVEHKFIIYPGATHSFFDKRYEEFADESADAWKQMLSFIEAHTPQTSST